MEGEVELGFEKRETVDRRWQGGRAFWLNCHVSKCPEMGTGSAVHRKQTGGLDTLTPQNKKPINVSFKQPGRKNRWSREK